MGLDMLTGTVQSTWEYFGDSNQVLEWLERSGKEVVRLDNSVNKDGSRGQRDLKQALSI